MIRFIVQTPISYKTSPTILAASLYVLSSFSHFSRSALMVSSSYKSSWNKSSLYSVDTSLFCTTSFEWLTRRCIMALGTWSATVSRTMLKYDEMRRRMSSVSRASRSVSAGACSGLDGYQTLAYAHSGIGLRNSQSRLQSYPVPHLDFGEGHSWQRSMARHSRPYLVASLPIRAQAACCLLS